MWVSFPCSFPPPPSLFHSLFLLLPARPPSSLSLSPSPPFLFLSCSLFPEMHVFICDAGEFYLESNAQSLHLVNRLGICLSNKRPFCCIVQRQVKFHVNFQTVQAHKIVTFFAFLSSIVLFRCRSDSVIQPAPSLQVQTTVCVCVCVCVCGARALAIHTLHTHT